MNIKLEELENIMKNEYVKDKVEVILQDFKKDNEKVYLRAQALLEFLNVKILTKHFKMELPDFDIIRIAEIYRNVDKDLFEIMVSVNGEYNIVNTSEVSDRDIVTLLYNIDSVVEIINKKYPNVI